MYARTTSYLVDQGLPARPGDESSASGARRMRERGDANALWYVPSPTVSARRPYHLYPSLDVTPPTHSRPRSRALPPPSLLPHNDAMAVDDSINWMLDGDDDDYGHSNDDEGQADEQMFVREDQHDAVGNNDSDSEYPEHEDDGDAIWKDDDIHNSDDDSDDNNDDHRHAARAKTVRHTQRLHALVTAISRIAGMGTDMLGEMGQSAVQNRNKLKIVKKTLVTGPRGSAGYYTAEGKFIWLKREQKAACMRGELRGAEAYCPPDKPIGGYNMHPRSKPLPRAVAKKL